MRAITLSLTLMLLAPLGASAGELVMFESPVCEYCEMWDEEVGVIYDKTTEARLASLRRVDIYDDRPADLEDLGPVLYTPTFVLVEGGREIGRILGYPGEEFFWGLLNGFLAKLDQAAHHAPARP